MTLQIYIDTRGITLKRRYHLQNNELSNLIRKLRWREKQTKPSSWQKLKLTFTKIPPKMRPPQLRLL